MRAAVFDRYGPPDVLRVADVEQPRPGQDEVLVRVRASTVSRSDSGLRGAEYLVARAFTGLLRPREGKRIVGLEFAGEVEQVGAGVTEFAPGDRVFGIRSGSNAEYICVRERGVVAHMPASRSFEEAAPACDGAMSALTALRRVGLREGQRILVYGASGSIGTAAVQLAKHHVGAHVTGVCDGRNVDLVRSLGADEVLDYERQDITEWGFGHDVVFDAVGKRSFRRCRRALRPGGIYISTDPGAAWHLPAVALLTRWLGERRATMLMVRYTKEDAVLLAGLLESGAYRPVVDRTYPLEDVVEAHRYVDTHQKVGNVVLRIGGSGS